MFSTDMNNSSTERGGNSISALIFTCNLHFNLAISSVYCWPEWSQSIEKSTELLLDLRFNSTNVMNKCIHLPIYTDLLATRCARIRLF